MCIITLELKLTSAREVNMDLNKLKQFCEVAKSLSFTDAAKFMNISQSALSRAIMQLESEVGAKLFERHHRGLLLTREGEILYDSGLKILSESEYAQDAINSERKEIQGDIRFATVHGIASYYLPFFVADFLNMNPSIDFELISVEKPPDFEVERIDAGIYPTSPALDHLIHRKLLTIDFALYASQSYIDKYGMPSTVEDLDNHVLIGYGVDIRAAYVDADWHLTLGCQDGISRKARVSSNSSQARFELAMMGVGIASLARQHPPRMQSNLIRILPDVNGPSTDFFYIYPKRHRESRRIKILGEYFAEAFKEFPDVLFK